MNILLALIALIPGVIAFRNMIIDLKEIKTRTKKETKLC